jgi:hypothetical protein
MRFYQIFKTRLTNLLFLIAFSATFFASTTSYSQVQLALSPMLVELELAPGTRRVFSLRLDNGSNENSMNLIAYTGDMMEEQDGAYKVIEKGQSEFSCADWIKLSETEFTIPPSGSKEIKAEITVPRDAGGGRYAAVVFEIVPEKREAGKDDLGSVTYHFRMPAFVELSIRRFGWTAKKVSITDFKVEAFSSEAVEKKYGPGSMRFTASVKNEGKVHVIGKGNLLIKTPDGKRKRQVPLGGGRGAVIPGATVDFTSILRKLPPGEYIAQAMIKYGSPSPAVAETPFSVGLQRKIPKGFTAASFLALEIKPERLEMQIPPLGFRTTVIQIENQESTSVILKANLMGMQFDEEGNLIVVDTSETSRSCAGWLKIEPPHLTLPPRGRDQVKLTVQVPAEHFGGYYACLVLEASTSDSQKAPLATPFQIPIIISSPPNFEKKGEIVDIEVSAVANKPGIITARFKNTGNMHVKPRGRAVMKVLQVVQMPPGVTYAGEPKYENVGTIIFDEVKEFVLPEGISQIQGAFAGSLPAGNYLAEVLIDYGGKEPVKAEKKFILR